MHLLLCNRKVDGATATAGYGHVGKRNVKGATRILRYRLVVDAAGVEIRREDNIPL